MTPQEIAERALAYGEPKEPTIVFVALREAAARASREHVIDATWNGPRESDMSLQPGWMA